MPRRQPWDDRRWVTASDGTQHIIGGTHWWMTDYRIMDENGREVWASKLSKRYVRESAPRRLWDDSLW